MRKDESKFIGRVAVVLFNKNVKLDFANLRKILKSKNISSGNLGDRVLAAKIIVSYDYWKKDPTVQKTISSTYTSPDGYLPWD